MALRMDNISVIHLVMFQHFRFHIKNSFFRNIFRLITHPFQSPDNR